MADATLPHPDRPAARLLALRAIMDGRGVEGVILSSPRSLAHYGGPGMGKGGLLVVTARAAVAARSWAEAAALLPPGCALGHDGQIPEDALGEIERLARPRGVLSISADVARQTGDE